MLITRLNEFAVQSDVFVGFGVGVFGGEPIVGDYYWLEDGLGGLGGGEGDGGGCGRCNGVQVIAG